MNIIKLYKAELQKHETKIYEKRKEIDGQIISDLLKDNIPKDTIKAIIKTNSVLLKNKMPDFVNQYLDGFDYSGAADVKAEVMSYNKVYDTKKAPYIKGLISFYENIDSDIAAKLSDEYKLHDIGQTILRENKLNQDLHILKPIDSNVAKAYVDSVLNTAREKISLQEKKKNEIKMQHEIDISNKYLSHVKLYKSEHNINKFSRNDDITIATALLLEGYSNNQIISAIDKNSEVEHQADYGETIVNKCQKVLAQYKAINSFDGNEMTPDAIYKKMSQNAIKKNSNNVLNMFDDIQFIKYMKEQKFDNATIEKTLMELSPVANDPRRETAKYVNSLFGTVPADRNADFKKTIAAYENEIKNKREEITKQRDLLDNALGRDRAYNDGLTALKLLRNGHDKDSVINAISECSPNGKQEYLPDKTDKYAYFIVASALRNLDAEKAITNLPTVYQKKVNSIGEAQKANISNANLYRALINDRIKKMPNTIFMLNDENLDIDTSMRFIKDYGKEINREDLINTIREASPRAQLPGISADYVENIIDKSYERLNLIEKNIAIEKEQKSQNMDTYKKEYDFAKGGIKSGDKAQKEFLDGHAAMQMLQKGVLATDIRNTIADTCENKSLEERYMYADNIISQVKKSESRKLQIFNQYLKDTKPENLYKGHMKQLWQQKQYISSESDIDSALYMITKGVAVAEISATIMKYSPIAVEPGHNMKAYAEEYVTSKAQREYEKELDRQRKYTPIPSLGKSENPADEYKRHMLDYDKNCKLPITKDIDFKIAIAMINQGYKEKEIDNALSSMSPCSTGIKYGANQIKSAKEHIATNDKGNQIGGQSNTRQLEYEK